MAQFGSNQSILAQARSAVTDSNGNLIVSPDDGFGGSPLGVAARNQVEIGLPNGTFNILPPDANNPIAANNLLPYWDLYQDEGIDVSMVYDTTLQTWSVRIDPTAVGTALGTATLRARVPIINDEGLDVRHYVSGSLVQGVKVAGTSKWTAVLYSRYYDATGAAIGTPYPIGTVLERGTATSLAGYTNASGPIDTSAAELEVYYTLSVGTASPTYYLDLKSVNVATEYGVIGGGGGGGTAYIPLSTIVDKGDLILGTGASAVTRLLSTGIQGQVLMQGTATNYVQWGTPSSGFYTQVFNSNGTFTVPSGVSYVTVWAIGGGRGGASGRVTSANTTTSSADGGSGGSTSYWALRRDIYVGDVGSVTIGIGTGGTGGTAIAFSKAAAATTQKTTNPADTNPGDGGDTTFGTYFTVEGAKSGGTVTGWYGLEQIAGGNGGAGGNSAGSAGTAGTAHPLTGFGGAPFVYAARDYVSSGLVGGTATGSGGTGAVGAGGAANTASGFAGGGGGGGSGSARVTTPLAGAGGVGGPGGGGSGGGAGARYISATSTIVMTGGTGSNGAANSGAGGGGGGAIALAASGTATYNPSTITMTSGAGGAGGSGKLVVVWYAGTVTP
jgi:hypothetical protein